MKHPIIVWFRADLRVHDHPALAAAVRDGVSIVPVFIFDQPLTSGSYKGSNRNRFLLESLSDLKSSLQNIGGDLVVREGTPADVLVTLAKETNATAVYYIADYSPYATRRDKRVESVLRSAAIEPHSFGGKLIVSGLQQLRTKSYTVYKVFTPFWKQWMNVGRRELAPTPEKITVPSVTTGTLPTLDSLSESDNLSPHVLPGGETQARRRLEAFLDGPIADYKKENNDMGSDATSRLSAYLHFGCLSPLETETLLPDNEGARSWHRQLAWREFYYYILLHFPHPEREFQQRYRAMPWSYDKKLLKAWQDGMTGYPAVDAAMRQLKTEGWMHNRGRLIVGSFLTKDLAIDWREGERYFMRWLIDGDAANNNGNWQWIASVGVDPAPVFRRLYNPASQRDNYDPSGAYVRRYLPELKNVPDKYLSEPWKMPEQEQRDAKCIIGTDYPAPIVNHKQARLVALERYSISYE